MSLDIYKSKKLPVKYEKLEIQNYLCRMKASEINSKWKRLIEIIIEEFEPDGEPDLNAILFLIGIQELGQGPRKFGKRQKEELMHIATCRLLSEMGFYELQGLDQDGWPHWKQIKQIPAYATLEQEMLLKSLVVNYFSEIYDMN